MSGKAICPLAAALIGLLFVQNLPAKDTSGKAACDSTRVGEFWPGTANSSSQTMYQSAREGQLEICTRGLYRFAWRPLTVSYQQLNMEARQKEERRSGRNKPTPSALLSSEARP